ncbi:MAG: NADP oxidoreductase, partial [Calditrichaeota bacterium]|nr:NADP oxidoreductase [Calditrichota bacterium]
MTQTSKITLATAWLDGCSGCHMSFLDLDTRLIELAEKVDVVYSPIVDTKELPPQVDLGILEGAVSTEEDLHKARLFRERCKFLISLGDCAVSGNVPSMRNAFSLDEVF